MYKEHGHGERPSHRPQSSQSGTPGLSCRTTWNTHSTDLRPRRRGACALLRTWPVLFCLRVLAISIMLCAGVFSVRVQAQEAKFTMLRVPKMAIPPKLDGTLREAEWRGAAAFTGMTHFVQMNPAEYNNKLLPASMQTTFYMGYDDNNLYLGMRSLHPRGFYPKATIAWNADMDVFQDDHFEWQLSKHPRNKAMTAGLGFYKLMINPFDALWDNWFYGSETWGSAARVKSSFTRDAWCMEVAVPIVNLGAETLDGQQWVMQLVRSAMPSRYMYAGWGPGNWTNWSQFPEVVFAPTAPAVQLLNLGDVTAGQLEARLAISGTGTHEITATCTVLNGARETLYTATQSRTLRAGKRATLEFTSPPLTLDEIDNILEVDVLEGETILYHTKIPFNRASERDDALVNDWKTALATRPPTRLAVTQPTTVGWLRIFFLRKRLVNQHINVKTAALGKGDLLEAKRACRRLIDEAPALPEGYYHLSEVLARQRREDAAIAALEQAIARGWDNPSMLQENEAFATLRKDRRFPRLVADAATATLRIAEVHPTVVTDGIALVTDSNTSWDADTDIYRSHFSVDADAMSQLAITTIDDESGQLLRSWQRDHTVAGNPGDFYDNRDGGHANLDPSLFPQLSRIVYGMEAQGLGLNDWLPTRMIHPGVVIGNASLAQTGGPHWRSIVRAAYLNQVTMNDLVTQYASNRMYMYPSHLDHLPGHNGLLGTEKGGHGDVLPVNTPYLIASQGSSGTDLPFVQAIAMTLAAFKPDVKTFLAEHQALMPTVQMIFRMSNSQVTSPEDYLTGKAHPAVFSGDKINRLNMITMAQAMTRENTPPLVQLRLIEEDAPQEGRDYSDPQHRTEEICTTPSAIGRVWRGAGYTRRMVVSAIESRDLQRRPLSFHWVVLRGDAEKITFRSLRDDNAEMEITIAYQARAPIAPGEALESNRIDIGVFAYNGSYYSAPAFICYTSLDNEERVYDDEGRPRSIHYRTTGKDANYVDPMLSGVKNWLDEFQYSVDGVYSGWMRTYPDGRSERYNTRGQLLE